MNHIEQLTSYLAEYDNPIELKNKIHGLLNHDLYKRDEKAYLKLADWFYESAADKKDWPTKQKILCEWLLLSNFEEYVSLKHLSADPRWLSYLFSNNLDSEMKYQLWYHWYILQNIKTSSVYNGITNTAISILQDIHFATIKPDAYISNLNRAHLGYNITELYNFDNKNLIKITCNILSNVKDPYDLKKLQLLVSQIIETIDFGRVLELESIQLFKFSKFIDHDALAKLGTSYYKDKFQMLLNNASALGVIDNTDYWIQSLPTSQCTNNDSIELPKF